jgi:hypothetical protein
VHTAPYTAVHEVLPMSQCWFENDNSFTGKILKVVVNVKPIGAAIKAEAEKAHMEANLKKALSD